MHYGNRWTSKWYDNNIADDNSYYNENDYDVDWKQRRWDDDNDDNVDEAMTMIKQRWWRSWDNDGDNDNNDDVDEAMTMIRQR